MKLAYPNVENSFTRIIHSAHAPHVLLSAEIAITSLPALPVQVINISWSQIKHAIPNVLMDTSKRQFTV